MSFIFSLTMVHQRFFNTHLWTPKCNAMMDDFLILLQKAPDEFSWPTLHCDFQKIMTELVVSSLHPFKKEQMWTDSVQENLIVLLVQGKGLRAWMTLLCAAVLGHITRNHIIWALALEFLHGASLFHDDILDQGQIRRQVTCAYLVLGINRAVLLGDLFVSLAFSLLIDLDNKSALQLAQGTMHDLVTGQLKELSLDSRSTSFDYLSIIESKTAGLFMAASQGAAFLADASPPIENIFGQWGMAIGMAYQLNDDACEYDIPLEHWGKGHDFLEKKWTYPLILSSHRPDLKQAILGQLGLLPCQDFVNIYLLYGNTLCHRYAHAYRADARRKLAALDKGLYKKFMDVLPFFSHVWQV